MIYARSISLVERRGFADMTWMEARDNGELTRSVAFSTGEKVMMLDAAALGLPYLETVDPMHFEFSESGRFGVVCTALEFEVAWAVGLKILG